MAALFMLNIYYIDETFDYGTIMNQNRMFDNRLGSELFAASITDASINTSLGMGLTDSAISNESKEKIKSSMGMVRGAAQRNHLPVVHNPCPADGFTKRQEVKELVAELEHRYPGLKERVFGSMQRLPLPEWGPVGGGRRLRRRGMEDGDAE